MYFAWIGQEAQLSPAALTVRAQTVSPSDDGRLLWDVFFPRRDVNSIKVTSIYEYDFRPVSDRREWDARGRLIPQRTPKVDELEMVPIEAYFKLAEREIQALLERGLNDLDIFRRLVVTDLPSRSMGLVQANYRRIEMDAFRAWANGAIVARNPQSGLTGTFSFGFEAARYQTAATAWDVAANAYNAFIAWLEEAITQTGPIQGVMLRNSTFKEIQADAPQGVMAVQLTRTQVEDRIAQDLGLSSFRFYINERTLETFGDGGLATTAEYIWPSGKVAVVPAGERVGVTAFAPVARAMEISRAVPQAKVDIRGQTVYHEPENGGRGLTVEAQVNALPLPEERLLYVIDAGV